MALNLPQLLSEITLCRTRIKAIRLRDLEDRSLFECREIDNTLRRLCNILTQIGTTIDDLDVRLKDMTDFLHLLEDRSGYVAVMMDRTHFSDQRLSEMSAWAAQNGEGVSLHQGQQATVFVFSNIHDAVAFKMRFE